jgi:hypothetical protein
LIPVSIGATTEKALHSSLEDSFSSVWSGLLSLPKDNAKKEKMRRKVRMPTAIKDFESIVEDGTTSAEIASSAWASVIAFPPTGT